MARPLMEFDVACLSDAQRYRTINGCVTPRPIAWIASVGSTGVVNVAPFSWFSVVCSSPLIVSVSINRRAGQRKDSARNIAAGSDFTINMVSADLLQPMNATAADFPPEVSEAQAIGLALAPSVAVAAPRIAAARAQLECRLHRLIEVGAPVVADLVLAEVVHIRVADDLLEGDPAEGRVSELALDPLARMGGVRYARLGEVLELARPGTPTRGPV